MKKFSVVFMSMILALVICSSAFAADVALTSVGQSPDAMMIKVVLKSLKVKPDYNAVMKPEDLSGQKVLIAVVGGSSKGLGAAGIDKDEEVARAQSLFDKARADGMNILVMHIGGSGRRGTLSDLFIEFAVPQGEKLILVNGADADGFFKKLTADKGIEILSAKNVRGTKDPLEVVLTEWGIL